MELDGAANDEARAATLEQYRRLAASLNKPRKPRNDGPTVHPSGLVTEQRYSELLQAQGDACAICHEPAGAKRLAVDHDHRTGNVRGLLCHRCNLALGLFGDSADVLESAIGYLIDAALHAQVAQLHGLPRTPVLDTDLAAAGER